MKIRSLRYILLPLPAIAMVCLNGCCCCPYETRAELMEDFAVSTDKKVEWLQRQRAMSQESGAPGDWAYDPAYGGYVK